MTKVETYTTGGEALDRWVELARERSHQLKDGQQLQSVKVVFDEEEE